MCCLLRINNMMSFHAQYVSSLSYDMWKNTNKWICIQQTIPLPITFVIPDCLVYIKDTLTISPHGLGWRISLTVTPIWYIRLICWGRLQCINTHWRGTYIQLCMFEEAPCITIVHCHTHVYCLFAHSWCSQKCHSCCQFRMKLTRRHSELFNCSSCH